MISGKFSCMICIAELLLYGFYKTPTVPEVLPKGMPSNFAYTGLNPVQRHFPCHGLGKCRFESCYEQESSLLVKKDHRASNPLEKFLVFTNYPVIFLCLHKSMANVTFALPKSGYRFIFISSKVYSSGEIIENLKFFAAKIPWIICKMLKFNWRCIS